MLFRTSDFPLTAGREYDITPEGDRFLFRALQGVEDARRDSFTGVIVVLNWTQELIERVPVN